MRSPVRLTRGWKGERVLFISRRIKINRYGAFFYADPRSVDRVIHFYWGSFVVPEEKRKYRAYVQLRDWQFEYRLFNKCRYVGGFLRWDDGKEDLRDSGLPRDENVEQKDKFKLRLAV